MAGEGSETRGSRGGREKGAAAHRHWALSALQGLAL